MCEYWHMRVFVDHVNSESVPGFHQDVQIRPTGVQFHPSGVVPWIRSVDVTDESKVACLTIFLVRPDLVPS